MNLFQTKTSRTMSSTILSTSPWGMVRMDGSNCPVNKILGDGCRSGVSIPFTQNTHRTGMTLVDAVLNEIMRPLAVNCL